MKQENLRFFRAADGAPRAEGLDDTGRVLALFLESDLQDDPTLSRELLDRLSRGPGDDMPRDAFIGNAFAVTVDGDVVILSGHSEGNDQTAMLTPERMEQAVDEWLAFISAGPRSR